MKPQLVKLVEEYMKDFNQDKAAVRAGYSAVNVNHNAYRLFKKEEVQREIALRLQKRYSRLEVNKERIVEEYAKIAFSNFGDLLDIHEDGSATIDLNRLTDDQKAALEEYTVEEYMEGRGKNARGVKKSRVKFASKKAALDSLARHLGMFNDKLTIDGDASLIEALTAGRKRMNKENKGVFGDDAS